MICVPLAFAVVVAATFSLPAVALDQFSSSMDLSNLRWMDKCPKILQEVASTLQLQVGEDVTTITSQLKGVLTQLARMAMEMMWEHTGRNADGAGQDGTLRFAHGVLPEALVEPLTQILAQATGLSKALEALGLEVKAVAKEEPSQAVLCAQLYAKLGSLAPRLGSLVSTAALLLEHGEQPLAKWLQAQSEHGYLTMTAHACPIVPGDLLRQFLWSQVRAAVVTSASLTSCGSFDCFLHEAGLYNNPNVTALEVASPFDYAAQGTLVLSETHADPKNADAFNAEMVDALLEDLTRVRAGALVLFTSREQMRQAVDRAPSRQHRVGQRVGVERAAPGLGLQHRHLEHAVVELRLDARVRDAAQAGNRRTAPRGGRAGEHPHGPADGQRRDRRRSGDRRRGAAVGGDRCGPSQPCPARARPEGARERPGGDLDPRVFVVVVEVVDRSARHEQSEVIQVGSVVDDERPRHGCDRCRRHHLPLLAVQQRDRAVGDGHRELLR